jgi:hypothetical protein
VDEFFARNELDCQSRDECLQFAQLMFPEEQVREADSQGQCSYTVTVSKTHILQFRPATFRIDMQIYDDARRIFKHLVAETTFVGTLAGIPVAPGRESKDGGGGPPLLHAYLVEKLPGVVLSSVLQKDEAPSRTFRNQLVQDLARIFANAYHYRILAHRLDKPATRRARGRIGSSLGWRANLLTKLSDRQVSKEAQAVRYYLGHIERLPWCLTHGDLIPTNILVDAQTGRITGLLDWVEGEWLPVGIGMYAIDECLGKDDAEKGFVYFPDHEEMAAVFWDKFLDLCRGHAPPELTDGTTAKELDMARRFGLLLWRGIAFDNGHLDRLVEAGRDDAELRKLKVLLAAPSAMQDVMKTEHSCLEHAGDCLVGCISCTACQMLDDGVSKLACWVCGC